MNLIIADDEYWVRASLAIMIKDMDESWELAGEAANGEELLELVAEHRPNIAIVDIRMPKMDGLEAIRRGKALSPLTKWIILSGFSDFEYAHQALKLGAAEYLLKPVDPANLEKTLQNIYKDNKDYVILLNQQFENQVFALCNGLTSLKSEDRESLFFRGQFIGWTFCIDTARPASGSPTLERQFYKELRDGMFEHLVFGMNLALTGLPNGDLAVIAAWDPEKGVKGRESVYRYLHVVKKVVQRYCSEEAAVTVLQTEECPGFDEVNGRLLQLQMWTQLRAVYGIGPYLGYNEAMYQAKTPFLLEAGRLLCAAGQHVRSGMYLHYQNSVRDLEILLEREIGIATGPFRHAVRRFIRYSFGLELPESASVKTMLRELEAYGETILHEKCVKESAPADLVEQVVRYVEERFTEDISIGHIAADLNVSANYLSTLFHKKTGVTFVKYMTRMRMLKAKELLLNTNLQVKQVAAQVGYYSTRHFTKLFTEAFGCYPSYVRDSAKN